MSGLRRLGRVTPGRAVSRKETRASGYIAVPRTVMGILVASGAGYALATWSEVSDHLWRCQKEQDNEGGLRPCDLLTRIRPDRSRATKYRHMALFQALGLLNRFAVDGRPQRGPGTRIRFALVHALRHWRPDHDDGAAAEPAPARPAPSALEQRPESPGRAPPAPERSGPVRDAGPPAPGWAEPARAILERLTSSTE